MPCELQFYVCWIIKMYTCGKKRYTILKRDEQMIITRDAKAPRIAFFFCIATKKRSIFCSSKESMVKTIPCSIRL